MSALLKSFVEYEYPVEAKSVKPVLSVVAVKVAAMPVTEAEAVSGISVLKNMLLFLSAPFVGLVYAVLLPFVGLAMLVRIGGKALLKEPAVREALAYGRFLLRMAAMPFVALGWLIALPFIAVGMLSWIGVKAIVGAA
jgi:hypothetical protein